MDFRFDTRLVAGYKSNSQRIRVMSEEWVCNNLFCPCCGNSRILRQRNNNPVGDFICDKCGEEFELKSKESHFGRKIVDGAYSTMIQRIESRNNPHLFILAYSDDFVVNDFVLIPKFFFVPSIIEKRKPLADTARRAGWVGCNILIGDVPKQGRIGIIEGRTFRDSCDVVENYQKVKELQINSLDGRGWLYDVLNCVNSVKGDTFMLSDIYKFVPVLRELHKGNNNIEAKIRQQLQFLRDKGFLIFMGKGRYKKIQ